MSFGFNFLYDNKHTISELSVNYESKLRIIVILVPDDLVAKNTNLAP